MHFPELLSRRVCPEAFNGDPPKDLPLRSLDLSAMDREGWIRNTVSILVLGITR